jgi:hypothetical protein
MTYSAQGNKISATEDTANTENIVILMHSVF